MEMHQLRYVVAVARARNFSRAAEQCHVSQPSLSQQILKLEQELGERLFDRMKREVKLTPHGQAFLPRAIKILEEVDVAKREACDAQKLLRGRIIVGVSADHCTVFAACRARSFRRKISRRGNRCPGGHDGAAAQARAHVRDRFRGGQSADRESNIWR